MDPDFQNYHRSRLGVKGVICSSQSSMQQKEIKVEVEKIPPTSIVVSSNATKVEEKLESEKSKEKKLRTVLLSTNQKVLMFICH